MTASKRMVFISCINKPGNYFTPNLKREKRIQMNRRNFQNSNIRQMSRVVRINEYIYFEVAILLSPFFIKALVYQ